MGGFWVKAQVVFGLVACLLAATAIGVAQDVEVAEETDNLSEGRSFGVGMQLDYPIGGLISGRYWFTPEVGAEGIVFFWGEPGIFDGIATARVLFRVSDTPAVDFYVATGASIPFAQRQENDAIFSGVGGIEFSFPFARNLAWNVEFGATVSTWGEVTMAIGSGIHFYF